MVGLFIRDDLADNVDSFRIGRGKRCTLFLQMIEDHLLNCCGRRLNRSRTNKACDEA